MEMTRISAGKLRALGYDEKTRTLQVELEDGSNLQYSGVSPDLWRRFKNSGSAWSFYRDNIEEEFAVKRVPGKLSGSKNPLDDLFS